MLGDGQIAPHPDVKIAPSMPSSDDLKNALRYIFDSQIPNYGDYNLIYARSRMTPDRRSGVKHYVVGYRRQPLELMIAPFNAPALSAGPVPVEVNMTNLSHAFPLAEGDYEVGTSTGRTFRFLTSPRLSLGDDAAGEGSGSTDSGSADSGSADSGSAGPGSEIDQAQDYADFVAFMSEFIEAAA